MGRNNADFYSNHVRAEARGPEGGAVTIAGPGKKMVTSVPDSGVRAVSRKITRNRDVNKQGARIAEVAVGNKKPAKKDM
jgi:hypothetical protein